MEALVLSLIGALNLSVADCQWVSLQDLMLTAEIRFPSKGGQVREATQSDIDKFIGK